MRRPSRGTGDRSQPNVLYIVWDDATIATWNAFGGLAETPTMKWLAGRGLRYTQWHTNAGPAPTRSCLLTGRNGLPGPGGHDQGAIIPPEAGTLAEILGRAGYRTYCVGQWHHSPQPEAAERPRAVTGSRRTWPLGRGFDRYYGFLGRQTSPWYPDLIYDNQHVDPPYPPDDGYHLSRDLADMAIEFLRDGTQAGPGLPWLCYLSLGASGAPQAAPREWAGQYRGRFDLGYDRYREVVLGNMKRLGIVPERTALALAGEPEPGDPEPGGRHLMRPWRSLTDEQRRLSSRLAELSAGLCSYTDRQIGRVLDYLGESGQLDDTIVVVCSANATPPGADDLAGAAGPAGGTGGPGGPADEAARGGQAADNTGSAGWAWAFRTPYSLPRQHALGGTAASPLIISWPPEMPDVGGGVRDQYHHAVDVVPTILDCAGVEPPRTIKGHLQAPLHGVSMRYTFTAPEAPSARRTQLYRAPGGRAIYHDGWKAVAAADGWQLYEVRADRAEARDVAARYPERLARLVSLWAAAARDQARPSAARAVPGRNPLTGRQLRRAAEPPRRPWAPPAITPAGPALAHHPQPD